MMRKQKIDRLMDESESRLIELIKTKVSKKILIKELENKGVSKRLIKKIKKSPN